MKYNVPVSKNLAKFIDEFYYKKTIKKLKIIYGVRLIKDNNDQYILGDCEESR
jgi:hypothetical protein